MRVRERLPGESWKNYTERTDKMAKGGIGHGAANVAGASNWQVPAEPWEKVPRWDWHRWFGLDLRRPHRRGIRNGIKWWEYGNSKKVARNVLSSMYANDAATQKAFADDVQQAPIRSYHPKPRFNSAGYGRTK